MTSPWVQFCGYLLTGNHGYGKGVHLPGFGLLAATSPSRLPAPHCLLCNGEHEVRRSDPFNGVNTEDKAAINTNSRSTEPNTLPRSDKAPRSNR